MVIIMIFYTSDLHLGHANIIKLCKRPFTDIDEMNFALISNWNKRVTNGDTVYICGDLMFRSATEPDLFLRQLRGKKHLVVGNHDSSWMKKASLAKYFESVEKLKTFSNGKNKISLCHYPMMSFEGKFLVHGHIHNNKNDTYWSLLRNMDNALNASVEINDYMPVTFEELVENNARAKMQDDSELISELYPFISRMKELTRTAYVEFSGITASILSGCIVSQREIERHLDNLLTFCSDDECHELYNKILGCIKQKYPEMFDLYDALYYEMWSDDQEMIVED